MTLIVDPTRFAIEYELLPQYQGVWLFGHVCFWIAGNRIGDFGASTTLRDFLFEIERGRRDHGHRINERLFVLSGPDIVTLLDLGLFVGDSAEIDKRALDEQWARHDISPHTETFIGWRIYLVESSTSARLVYGPVGEPEAAREIELAPGECDAVLQQACDTLGPVYEKEREAEGRAQ